MLTKRYQIEKQPDNISMKFVISDAAGRITRPSTSHNVVKKNQKTNQQKTTQPKTKV